MPAPPERSAEGARPAPGAAPLLAGAALERMRRLFLALALVACLVAVGAVAGMPDRTGGLRIAGLFAIGVLAAIWARSYQRGALSPVDEAVELAALFAAGLAAGPDPLLGLLYAGLCRRSLYGSRSRAAAGFAVYALALVFAVIADRGELSVVEALAQVPALAIGCAVMQAFAALLVRHEQSVARERVLRDASAALAAAPDRGSLYAAVLQAVERLAGGGPVAAAVLVDRGGADFAVRAAVGPWLPGVTSASVAAGALPGGVSHALEAPRACAIASPRLAGLELFAPPEVAATGGVCVPLSVRRRLLGFVAVFGDGADAPDHVGALATVAAEAALALAAIDSADSAADDRSIERLTERSRGMI